LARRWGPTSARACAVDLDTSPVTKQAIAAIPEPSVMLLCALGLGGIMARSLRDKRRADPRRRAAFA